MQSKYRWVWILMTRMRCRSKNGPSVSLNWFPSEKLWLSSWSKECLPWLQTFRLSLGKLSAQNLSHMLEVSQISQNILLPQSKSLELKRHFSVLLRPRARHPSTVSFSTQRSLGALALPTRVRSHDIWRTSVQSLVELTVSPSTLLLRLVNHLEIRLRSAWSLLPLVRNLARTRMPWKLCWVSWSKRDFSMVITLSASPLQRTLRMRLMKKSSPKRNRRKTSPTRRRRKKRKRRRRKSLARSASEAKLRSLKRMSRKLRRQRSVRRPSE